MTAREFMSKHPYFKNRRMCLMHVDEVIKIIEEFENQKLKVKLPDKQEIKCEKIDPPIVC